MITIRSAVAFAAVSAVAHAGGDAFPSAYEGGTSHDKVVPLTVATFDIATKNDPANSLWLLKFFQTWCGHCKRMTPVLEKVAPELHGQMAIGTIDCGKEKGLCDRFKVRSYPTLKFVLDGEYHDYPGGRDGNSIKQFAFKMSAPSVSAVGSYEEAINIAQGYEDTEGVAFVGYDEDAKGEGIDQIMQSTIFAQMFAQAARKQKAFAHFMWLTLASENEGEVERNSDKRLDSFVLPSQGNDVPHKLRFVNRIEPKVSPRLWVPNFYGEGATPSTVGFIEFIGAQNVPMVATLGPSNFQKIGKNGRPLVIGVVDMSNKDQVKAMKSDLTAFITESLTPQSVKDKYYYTIMDGVKWFRFLEQFRVTKEDFPQIFILDVPKNEFWQNVTYAASAEKFINAVEEGLIEADSAKKNMPMLQKVLVKFEKFFLKYFPYSLIALLLGVFGLVYLLVPSSNDLRPLPSGYFSDDLQLQEEDSLDQSEPAASTESKKDK